MFDAETIDFLTSGCALIIGTVDDEGAPRAARGWGLQPLDAEHRTFRLVLDSHDAALSGHFAPQRPIAVTATDVPTLHSMQLKGTILCVEPATEADGERAVRFCDLFFGDISATEGTPRPLLERLAPPSFAACVIEVTESYDQTPGPNAGSAIESAGS